MPSYVCEKQGAVDLISITQSLNAEIAPELSQVIEQQLGNGQPMAVLDLQRASLIDSAGLEVLLDCQEAFQARGGMLKLSGANGLCRDILRATGVEERFELYAETNEAVRSFSR